METVNLIMENWAYVVAAITALPFALIVNCKVLDLVGRSAEPILFDALDKLDHSIPLGTKMTLQCIMFTILVPVMLPFHFINSMTVKKTNFRF